MQQDRLHTRSGQSLVEAMIAISLLLIGFLGTITLINRSVGLTRVVADTYVGTYLASEGIEVTKNLIDANYIANRNFNNGFALCVNGCDWELENDTTWENKPPQPYTTGTAFTFDPFTGRYSYANSGIATTFKRKVTVTLKGSTGNEISVVSRVDWKARGGGISSVSLEDHFFNWYLAAESSSTTSTLP